MSDEKALERRSIKGLCYWIGGVHGARLDFEGFKVI